MYFLQSVRIHRSRESIVCEQYPVRDRNGNSLPIGGPPRLVPLLAGKAIEPLSFSSLLRIVWDRTGSREYYQAHIGVAPLRNSAQRYRPEDSVPGSHGGKLSKVTYSHVSRTASPAQALVHTGKAEKGRERGPGATRVTTASAQSGIFRTRARMQCELRPLC
jgi:hypothetical protein